MTLHCFTNRIDVEYIETKSHDMKIKKLNPGPMKSFSIVVFVLCSLVAGDNIAVDDYESSNGLFTIEGRVYAPEIFSLGESDWQRDTTISINNGELSGFLREDGTFTVSAVPSGSYVVEISNPDYYYESVSRIKLIELFSHCLSFSC